MQQLDFGFVSYPRSVGRELRAKRRSDASRPGMPALPPVNRPSNQPDRQVRDPRAPSRRRGDRPARPARDVPTVRLEEQQALPLPAQLTLTSSTRGVEAYLLDLVLAGREMPGNQRIGEHTGHCRSTVRKAIDKLIRLHRLDIQCDETRRRCHVKAVGLWSLWGECRPAVQTRAKRTTPREISDIITASMTDVSRVITRIANAGDVMPNNPLLGELAGGRGRSSALRALRRLVRAKVLALEVRASMRRVQICASGRWTGWGEARPGHAPYLHRARGEAVPEVQKKRKPQTRPLAPMIVAPSYQRLPPVSGFAEDCQYILDDHGERRRTPTFCCSPCERNSSFCPDHTALCFPGRKRTAAARPETKMELSRRLSTVTPLQSFSASQDVRGTRIYDTSALVE